ncbi:SprT family protein [Alkalibacillus aidingensis]|uniref:SprT family protein n=1 Tax=Alkalibacillus aidingensis TaxID=2747607 RepID=UPI001660A83E|nr:SprT family protein [Alkalibacillus aidingensis]
MEPFELERITKELSQKYFNKPFNDQVIFNKRLRTTGGRYIPSKRTIEINPKYYGELGIDVLIGIIKHELCHYHLHIEGKPYDHRSKEFRALLKATNSPRFCTPLPSEREKQKYKIQCQQCGSEYRRKRKVDLRKYRCGKCQGKLRLVTS